MCIVVTTISKSKIGQGWRHHCLKKEIKNYLAKIEIYFSPKAVLQRKCCVMKTLKFQKLSISFHFETKINLKTCFHPTDFYKLNR